MTNLRKAIFYIQQAMLELKPHIGCNTKELVIALDALTQLESKQESPNSKEEAKKYLIRLGVLNKDGELNENYKNICKQTAR